MKSLGREEEETAVGVLRLALHHQVSVLLGTAALSAFLSLRVGGIGGKGGRRRVEREEMGWSQTAAASFKVSLLVSVRVPDVSISTSILPIVHFLLQHLQKHDYDLY